MSLSYVTDYQERAWEVHELPLDGEEPKLAEPRDLFVCDSSSPRAASLKDDPHRFYVDCELLAAGLEPGAGAQIGRLEEPWRGYEPGTLVICSYEKLRQGKLVYAVEV